jgi:Acetyltransferase (GNAT) domain
MTGASPRFMTQSFVAVFAAIPIRNGRFVRADAGSKPGATGPEEFVLLSGVFIEPSGSRCNARSVAAPSRDAATNAAIWRSLRKRSGTPGTPEIASGASVMNAFAPQPFYIAQLGEERESALQDFFLNLDAASRYCRFSSSSNDDQLIRHSKEALASATWMAGAFADSRLCGVIELYRYRDRAIVEAALVVAVGCRRQGMGHSLLRMATAWASDAEIELMRMIFSRDNWPMRKLASKMNARFDLMLGEECADVCIAKLAAAHQSGSPVFGLVGSR